jgi:hypothetical protein
MLDKSQELLAELGEAILRAAPAEWTLLDLHATAAGGMTETALDVHRPDGSMDQSVSLDRNGRVACHELREAMHQPGKGSWYNARFTIDSQKQFKAEFDYENPPFDGNADDELLTDDQKRFPRDPDSLPDWHPSTRTSSESA